jgi:hypothetical protein
VGIFQLHALRFYHQSFPCSDVRDWLNKDEEGIGYQNFTEEEITEQAEENGSSEKYEEEENGE